MAGLHLVLGNAATDFRHEPQRHGLAFRLAQGGDSLALEGRFLAVGFKPDGGLVDDAQRGLVTALGVWPPGEQAVAAQHHADILRMFAGHAPKLDTKIDTRPLPRQIAHFLAKDVPGEFFRIPRRRNGDHRVGMHMIDVGVGHIAVQAGVDRGGARIEIEGAVVEVVHHLVFLIEMAIEGFERFQLVHVEGGEAIELHRADVAARALDPQDRGRLLRQRIGHRHLGGGVAAAEIGDPEVGAQEIGAIQQQARLIEQCSLCIIPERWNGDGIGHGVPAS